MRQYSFRIAGILSESSGCRSGRDVKDYDGRRGQKLLSALPEPGDGVGLSLAPVIERSPDSPDVGVRASLRR